MKKLLFLVLLMIVVLFNSVCFAEYKWYTCYVDRVGGYLDRTPPFYLVLLTDTSAVPAFSRMYFRIPQTGYKEGLAVFLTAISSGMEVMVYVDPSITDIYNRYVKIAHCQ